MLTLEISYDHVILCGQFVKRPTGLARSIWVKFWEEINGLLQQKKYKP